MEEKNINIDLLKVMSMFMIVVLHLITKGGSIEFSNYNSLNYFVFYLIMIIVFVCVNIFALLTGYLMVNKNIKLKSIIHLWLTVIFYSFLILLVSLLVLGNNIDKKIIFNSLFPLTRKLYWYFSCYFGLYLLIPFLNKMILNLTKKEMKLGILAIFILGSLSIVLRGDPFGFTIGYTTIWLACMYFIGSYLKLHFSQEGFDRKKTLIKYIIVNLILFLIVVGLSLLTTLIFGYPKMVPWFIEYVSPFIILSTIYLVKIVLSIDLKNTYINKLILFLSPMTFSVYLIHTNPIIFNYVIKDIMQNFANKNMLVSLFYLFSISITIYIICTIIDLIRIKLFQFLKVSEFSKKTGNYLERNIFKIINKNN